jgi:hypothetical protein
MNLKAISIAVIAAAASLSSAQGYKPVGVDVRVGDFLPTDSGTQGVGNSWLDFGLDFELHRLSPSAHLAVSFDYAYREGYRSMPLLLNYVIRRGPAYVLAGVGGNFNVVPQSDGSTYTQTTFAYDLGIGYDFLHNAGNPIFIEGRFFGDQKADINGFGVFLGIRM